LTNSAFNTDNDTTSSVFYDYGRDIAYVGDSAGVLHKFTPFFFGTPAEIRNASWPLELNPSNPNALTDPVYDAVSGNLFIGDAGGFVYLVDPTNTNPTVVKSGQLDFGAGIVQGPTVDSLSKYVYVFASSDGTTNCAGVACAAVYQLSTNFSAGNTGSRVEVGTSVASGDTPNPMYFGAFDSTYVNSTNATGNLYVCGATGVSPTLYRIPISAGTMGTPAALPTLTPAADHPACSPVTDVLNPNAVGGPAERLYFSVQDHGRATLCNGKGCAMSFVDTPWQASTSYQVGQEILVLRTQNNTLYVDIATTAGTTASTAPTWPAQVGTVTVNGTVSWLNQGPATVVPLANWTQDNAYALHARIVDSNGNVEIVVTAGTSAGSAPIWKTTAGSLTADGSVTWENAGVWPNSALESAGGTSGIIIDNFVETLPGASQVYFSTLGNQTCTTSGTTGGCAVQASQSSLQ
jgi:hypothetical protein